MAPQVGRMRSIEYVNELLARLTDKPVQDYTMQHTSLQLPLRRTVYANLTHEN